jgi:hypothetical protein
MSAQQTLTTATMTLSAQITKALLRVLAKQDFGVTEFLVLTFWNVSQIHVLMVALALIK